MKRGIKFAVASILIAGCILPMAACNRAGTLTKEPNAGISQGVAESVGEYDKIAYFSMEEKKDVRISLEASSVQKVSYKRNVLDGNDWSFKGNRLTVKRSVFEGESAGDKILRVFVDGSYLEITVRIVSKVIYTVEDFNNIRYNLNGSYTLANDLDFADTPFVPIGKTYEKDSDGKYITKVFEGVFDGGGHAIKNITIEAYEQAAGEDDKNQGPSLGDKVSNGANYNNGIFMTTSANSQIINTNFVNITVNCQGISGPVAGTNGGLIKNCFVSSNLTSHGSLERAGGICGFNSAGDSNGRIENCIAIYKNVGGANRGIADWSTGLISNCYAANTDSYVFDPAYNTQTGKLDPDFDLVKHFSDFYEAHKDDPAEGGGKAGVWCLAQWWSVVALTGSCDTERSLFYSAAPGKVVNSNVVRKEFLLDPHNFTVENGWDRTVWEFREGQYPRLIVK